MLHAALAADARGGGGGGPSAGALAAAVSEAVLRAGAGAADGPMQALTGLEHARLTALRLAPPPPPHGRALAGLWQRLPALVRAAPRAARRALRAARCARCRSYCHRRHLCPLPPPLCFAGGPRAECAC